MKKRRSGSGSTRYVPAWKKHSKPNCQVCGKKTDGGGYHYWCGKRRGLW